MSIVAPLPLSFNIAPRRLALFIVLSMFIHAAVVGIFYKSRFQQVDDVITIPTKNISLTLIDPIERVIVDERPIIKPVEKKIITTENTSAVVLPAQEPKPIEKKVIKDKPIEKPKPKVVKKTPPIEREAASPPPNQAAQPIESFAPLPIHRPKPHYPMVARRRGTEGEVTLEVTLLNNGSVNRAFIIESSGSSLLDNSALKAIKSWRFPPSRFNSLSSFRQRIKFRLDDLGNY